MSRQILCNWFLFLGCVVLFSALLYPDNSLLNNPINPQNYNGENYNAGSTPILPASSESGLLFYESFENASTIDANQGVAYNTADPEFVDGIKGNALNFGGWSTRVSYPLQDNYNETEGTIQFWIKSLPGYGPPYGFFGISSLSGLNPNSMGIFYNNGYVITEIRNNATSMYQAWSSTGLSAPYPWYLIAYTWKDGQMTTYVNGVPGWTISYSDFHPDLSKTFTVGWCGWYGYSKSMIDEVKIYNYSRTSSQILNEYNALIKANIPPIKSYWPAQDVVYSSIGQKLSFKIFFKDIPSKQLTLTWYVDGAQVKQVTGNSSLLYVTINKTGATRIEIVAQNGEFKTRKSWDVLVLQQKSMYSSPGYVLLNNSAPEHEWSFNIPQEAIDSAKYAIVTVDFNKGIYSTSMWTSKNNNGAIFFINNKSAYYSSYIKRIKNEYYCNGKYYGNRCNTKSMKFAIPVSLLKTSMKIKISAKNATWDINKVSVTLDPNDNVVIAGKKLYVNGTAKTVKGMSYAPWLSGTGPDPNVHEPFPDEYDDVTTLVGSSVPDFNQNGKIEGWEVVEYDLRTMKYENVNNIRTYATGFWHDQNLDGTIQRNGNCNISELVQGDVPFWAYDRIIDYAMQNDMYVTMGYWVQEEDYNDSDCANYATDYNDLEVAKKTMDKIVAKYGYQPSILVWGIGNEVNLYQNHEWFSWDVDINEYLNKLCNYTKTIDQNRRPIMYAKYIGENANFNNLPCYDIMAPNAYIFSANSSELLNEFTAVPPSGKTYLLGEYGHNIGDASGQWLLAKKYGGGYFLEYNDVWWKGSAYYFGIVDQWRTKSTTRFAAVRALYYAP